MKSIKAFAVFSNKKLADQGNGVLTILMTRKAAREESKEMLLPKNAKIEIKECTITL